MKVLAIDPGNVRSAYVVYAGVNIGGHGTWPNSTLLEWLEAEASDPDPSMQLVIEQVKGMGMVVGETTFETVFWSGRFAQAWGRPFHRIPRIEVKLHLCGQARAKDANVRQALIDRIGPQGTKRQPGPCYGIKGDEWAALAVAVTWWDHNVHITTGSCRHPICSGIETVCDVSNSSTAAV